MRPSYLWFTTCHVERTNPTSRSKTESWVFRYSWNIRFWSKVSNPKQGFGPAFGVHQRRTGSRIAIPPSVWDTDFILSCGWLAFAEQRRWLVNALGRCLRSTLRAHCGVYAHTPSPLWHRSPRKRARTRHAAHQQRASRLLGGHHGSAVLILSRTKNKKRDQPAGGKQSPKEEQRRQPKGVVCTHQDSAGLKVAYQNTSQNLAWPQRVFQQHQQHGDQRIKNICNTKVTNAETQCW